MSSKKLLALEKHHKKVIAEAGMTGRSFHYNADNAEKIVVIDPINYTFGFFKGA